MGVQVSSALGPKKSLETPLAPSHSTSIHYHDIGRTKVV